VGLAMAQLLYEAADELLQCPSLITDENPPKDLLSPLSPNPLCAVVKKQPSLQSLHQQVHIVRAAAYAKDAFSGRCHMGYGYLFSRPDWARVMSRMRFNGYYVVQTMMVVSYIASVLVPIVLFAGGTQNKRDRYLIVLYLQLASALLFLFAFILETGAIGFFRFMLFTHGRGVFQLLVMIGVFVTIVIGLIANRHSSDALGLLPSVIIPWLPVGFSKRIWDLSWTIVNTFMDLLKFWILMLIFILFYSQLGYRLWKDTYSASPETIWTSPQPANFDNFGNSFLSMFILLTTESYPDAMTLGYEKTPAGAIAFFWSFIIIMVFLVMSAFVAVLVQQYRIQIHKRARREKHKEQLACTVAFILLRIAQEQRGKSDFDEQKFLETDAKADNRFIDRYLCERLAKIWTPSVDIKEMRVMFGIKLRIDLPTFLEFCETHNLYMKESRYQSLKVPKPESIPLLQNWMSKLDRYWWKKHVTWSDAALVLAVTILVSFDHFSIPAAIVLFSLQVFSFVMLLGLHFGGKLENGMDWRNVYDVIIIIAALILIFLGATQSHRVLEIGFSVTILRLITCQDRIRKLDEQEDEAEESSFEMVKTFAPFLTHLLFLLLIVISSFSMLFTMIFPGTQSDELSLAAHPFKSTTSSLLSGFQILTTSNWHCKLL
jgi:hypothetical protein